MVTAQDSTRIRPLDGLRAVAIGLVVAYHAQVPGFGGGGVGVELFFTLSGFLITGVLLRPRALTSGGMKRFYIRRVLRLFPALIVAAVFCVLYAALVLEGQARSFLLTEAATSLTYTTDFYLGYGHRAGNDWGTLGHTWSLGVEEQFYLVWPVAMLLLLRRFEALRTRLSIVLLVAIADTAWRASLSARGLHEHVGFAFDTHVDVLLIGCALGLALPALGDQIAMHRQRAVTATAVAALGILGVVAMVPPHLGIFPLDTGYLVIALATAAIIVRLVVPATGPAASAYVRIFSLAPVVWIGAISYGIYLWHVIVFDVYKQAFDIETFQQRAAFAPLLLATTLAVATLSYYLVELPFLRLKDRRFQDRPALSRRPAGPTTVASAVAAASKAAPTAGDGS
jgi:peptidoglycan/LPS O-acetylase OafA/YrhL